MIKKTHIRPTDLMLMVFGCVCVGFFVNHNIQFKIVDSLFYKSFENIAITIGSPAFVMACVYRPPGSCSDAFCDEFFNMFEYLSSVSQNFLICGDFNIHVDTTSKDSEKFLNCLETCNINQHVHKPTHPSTRRHS